MKYVVMLDPGNYGGEYGFPIKVCETKDAAENFKNELSSKTFPNKHYSCQNI
jgi:hypothetical protein